MPDETNFDKRDHSETQGDEIVVPNKKENDLEASPISGRRPWIWRLFGVVGVFLVWLLYGGSLSATGAILTGLLVVGGGILVWLSYKGREGKEH